MENVKVKKAELLSALTTNREAHVGIFNEAVQGYKEQAIALLNQHLEAVQAGKMRVVSVHLPLPENHTKDYDRVIKMVEMNVEDLIELDEEDFSAYVMDDWRWKNQFLTSNSAYSGTATRALGG